MKYRKLGSSGLEVSTIALGTWAVGGGPWWGESDDQESIRAIHAAIDAGVNLIDTAPVYGFGHSEEVVGLAVRDRRDKVIIASKCGLWWDDDSGTPYFEQSGRKVRNCLEPRTIRSEVDNSLRRLGIDCIDLMQTHKQVGPGETRIADTMECLMRLRSEGKIREIGVSTCTPAQMDEYRAAGVLVSNQPRYSMLDRAIESEVLPYCIKHNIAVLAYTPLEQGLLTGKIGMDTEIAPELFRNNIAWFAPGKRSKVLQMLEAWCPLTEKYGCTMAQLVLAWTVEQPGVTSALCGARKVSHAVENAGAGAVEISADDIALMRCDVEAVAPAT